MLEISNTTKQTVTLSESKLTEAAHDILGTSYDVSVVIIGDKKALSLNKDYRNKDYIPNVLSFPIDETMGEIFLNPKTARLEAPKFGLNVPHYLHYLIIHSMLHLKGLDHGDEMDAKEKFFMKKFFGVELEF
jgi:probable rRNA maturation factor